jgi:hypothetical protein
MTDKLDIRIQLSAAITQAVLFNKIEVSMLIVLATHYFEERNEAAMRGDNFEREYWRALHIGVRDSLSEIGFSQHRLPFTFGIMFPPEAHSCRVFRRV